MITTMKTSNYFLNMMIGLRPWLQTNGKILSYWMALRSPNYLQPGSAFHQAAWKKVPDLLGEFTAVNGGRRNVQLIIDGVWRPRLLGSDWFSLLAWRTRRWRAVVAYLYDLKRNCEIGRLLTVHAVSPAIYRIFMRLIRWKFPVITNYIRITPKKSVMTVGNLRASSSDNLSQQFHSESVVDSSSLTSWLCSWTFR